MNEHDIKSCGSGSPEYPFKDISGIAPGLYQVTLTSDQIAEIHHAYKLATRIMVGESVELLKVNGEYPIQITKLTDHDRSKRFEVIGKNSDGVLQWINEGKTFPEAAAAWNKLAEGGAG